MLSTLGSEPTFAACGTNDSIAGKTDFGISALADAALARIRGRVFAASQPISSKRSLPTGFRSPIQTALSLLGARTQKKRDKTDLCDVAISNAAPPSH